MKHKCYVCGKDVISHDEEMFDECKDNEWDYQK